MKTLDTIGIKPRPNFKQLRQALLRDGKPEQIRKEVKRICESGIMEGGRFVLREANNLAPCTPIENVEAMYAAGKEYGRYKT